jgi:type II secretory ATPase GspE/PulE/Tfp pilus assembly ATPase PilB-like protein
MFASLPQKKIVEYSDLKEFTPNLVALERIPFSVAEKTQTCVLDEEEWRLAVLTTNNHPALLQQVLDKLHAQDWKTTLWYTDDHWFSIIKQWYANLLEHTSKQHAERSYRETVRWAEAIQLIKDTYAKKDMLTEGAFLQEIIRLTFMAWCSDLHFQAEEMGVVMRVRKDWILQTVLVFSLQEFQKYLMQIKYMAKVRMNVEAQSQDWRFDMDLTNASQTLKIDIRVSIMPSLRGESVVLRFLDWSKSLLSLDQLGMIPYHQQIIQKNLHKNYGMILISWPTWSWKTTTVYTMISMINDPTKKIVTFEDPVEYELPGIEQNQINEKKWFTFEEWLKWVLRHDPDIIMVWEIRSLESAEMAINAALTWHLVISTIHTNTAIEAITRLLNMGVKPYMLAPAINLVVWQRLVRTLADGLPFTPWPDYQKELNNVSQKLFAQTNDAWYIYPGTILQPDSTDTSLGHGYEGRVWIYECFELNQTIKSMLLSGASTIDIYTHAMDQWFITMKDDGFGKVLKWLTSIAEIERVI